MQRYNDKINIRYYVMDEGRRGIYQKVTQGRENADKKVTPHTQKIFMPFFSAVQLLFLYISWDSDNITVLNKKHMLKVICASEIFYHIIVNTCVSLCKSECANSLKLQFLTFFTSFDVKWYAKLVLAQCCISYRN